MGLIGKIGIRPIGLRNTSGFSFSRYWATQIKSRMEAAGDSVSPSEYALLENTIKWLLKYNLFDKRFDCFWVANSRVGREAAKINWIKDAHPLVEQVNGGALTYTASKGFASDGTKSYLSADYVANTHADKFFLNDASFIFKLSGSTTSTLTRGHGCSYLSSINTVNYAAHYNALNTSGTFGRMRYMGWNALARNDSASITQNVGYIPEVAAKASQQLAADYFCLLSVNEGGAIKYPTGSSEFIEFAAIGGSVTYDEYILLCDIMDAYMSGVNYVPNTKPKSMVVFTFDDGNLSDYSIAYPLFLSKGCKATFHLITDLVATEGYMTWANAKTMHDNDMSMQCHSKTHTDMRSLSAAELRAELEAVNAAFAAANIPTPDQTAYPFGYNNATVRGIVAEYRKRARAIQPERMDASNDRYLIPAYDISGLLSSGLAARRGYIDAAIQERKSVVFYAHGMKSGDSEGYLLGENQLTNLMDHSISRQTVLDVGDDRDLYTRYYE